MTTTPTFWSAQPTFIPGGNNFGDVSITALAEGGFALAYTEVPPLGATNVAGRIVSGAGVLGTDDILASASITASPLRAPDLVQLADGQLVATFSFDFSPTDTDIYSARLSGPGYTSSSVVSVDTSSIDDPIVYDTARTNGGGSVVLFQRGTGQVAFQRLSDNGSRLGAPFEVGTSDPGIKSDGDVTVLANGTIVTAWRSLNATTFDSDLRMQLFDAQGVPLGQDFIYATAPNPAFPQVLALAGGGYIAVWQDVSFGSILHFVFNESGNIVGPLRGAPSGFSVLPQMTALLDGGYIIGWSDFNGIEGDGTPDGSITLQRYSASGIEVGGRLEIEAPGDQSLQDLTTLSDGRVVVAYTTETGDSTNSSRIVYQIIDPRESSLQGGAGADEIYARLDDTFIDGKGGNDELFGQGGRDVLLGGTGNDLLSGGNADDVLRGDAGNDRIEGGAGIDRASYAGASGGVQVTLGTPGLAQNTLGAGIDTLFGIENLSGSDFNDILIGDAGANQLLGGNGNDTLRGDAGNDRLDGGAGIDRASYATATAGVQVSLNSAGVAQNTLGAGFDTLVGIENLSGSNFNDVLIGDSGANQLFGLYGTDTLRGFGGADRFTWSAAGEAGTSSATSDQVRDFVSGTDKLDFSGIDANDGLAGNQAFTWIGQAAFSAAGQLRFIRDANNDILVSGSTDGDTAAEFFVRLNTPAALFQSDVLL